MSTATKNDLSAARAKATEAIRNTQTVQRQLNFPPAKKDDLDIVVSNVLRNEALSADLQEAQTQLSTLDRKYIKRETMLRELLPNILG